MTNRSPKEISSVSEIFLLDFSETMQSDVLSKQITFSKMEAVCNFVNMVIMTN